MNAQLRHRRFRQVTGIAVLPILFILPIVLVLVIRISATHQFEEVEERTDTLIGQAHTLREQIFGIESAVRGYLLTGDSGFRLSFADQRKRAETALAAIENDAAANGDIAPNAARLSRDMRVWLARERTEIAYRHLLPRTSDGGIFRDRLVDSMLGDLDAILEAKSAERDKIIGQAETANQSMIAIVVICGLLAAIATGLSVRRTLILIDIEQRAQQERERLSEARRRTAELERDNVRIRSADKFKGEYLATMSHELRTPLTAMLGFSEVVRDGKLGPINDDQAEALDHVITSGRHLLELVGTVLDLAKVEAGKLDVSVVVADPRVPTRDVIDGMRELAARKSIRIGVDLTGSPKQALIDPQRFRQILYNYLSNAIKFTPTGGTVAVTLLPEGSDGFRLAVTDNGIGIDKSNLTQLFKEFRQIDLAGGTQPGTGLGLALTKRLTEAQGGYVDVRSVRGEGSTFFAVFPNAVTAAMHDARKVEATVA
jgi:signal transduction histidine kinase